MYIITPEDAEALEAHPLTKSLNTTEKKLFKENDRQYKAYQRGEREADFVELRYARDKLVEARTWLNIYLLHEMGKV